MATVNPITDALSAPPSTSLVLPPTTTAATTADVSGTDGTNTTTDTTTSLRNSVLGGVTSQPLAVVLDALASAGVDNAISQQILDPSVAEPTGTFSVFMEQLFTTLAAQSEATQQQQAAQAAATQRSAAQQAATQQPAVAAVATAFVASPTSATPNSALEAGAQSLAQSVNAPDAATTSVSSLTPLQQSFDQFVIASGSTPENTSLGGFLTALAGNLHTATSPLGNILNAQA